MKFLILFLLWFAVIFPFIWLWHSFTYDIARQQVKSMGRKGNYDYTVKHELFGWVVVRKKQTSNYSINRRKPKQTTISERLL